MSSGYPASIVEAFVRHAERAPEKPCLRFEDEEWTYGSLHGRSLHVTAGIGGELAAAVPVPVPAGGRGSDAAAGSRRCGDEAVREP